jgi:prepilin-type N-terminal cleavage/methylation domain-containing protein
MANTTPRFRRSGAFTLIEMLVVLVIIAILAGIVISLAQRVSGGGKYAATRNVIQAAEGMLTDYISRREAEAPLFVRTNQTTSAMGNPDQPDVDEEYMFPLIDGRYEGRSFPPQTGGPAPRFDKDRDPPQPAAALLLLEMVKESPEVERTLQGIDPRFLERRDMYAFGWRIDPATNEPTGSLVLRKLRIPQLIDAFGNPLRYVHPGFQGGYGNFFNNDTPPTSTNRKYLELAVAGQNGQPVVAVFSRCYRPFGPNVVATDPVGDADEGLAIGGHGYFYSSGLDADPGTRQDNVYNRKPSFPPETANFQ